MVSISISEPGTPAAAEDESRLLERARAGDRHAVDALVRRYLPDVVELTTRMLGDRELAADAAQDTFVNAIGALARFRGESSFRTWVLRIAANAARSLGRRKGRRRESDLEDAGPLLASGRDPEDEAAHRQEAERLSRAMARLPEKQRIAVTLRTYQGMSYRDIGIVAECSEGAARVNYHLGVKRLRELLTCVS